MGAARYVDLQRLRRPGRAVVFGNGFEGEFLGGGWLLVEIRLRHQPPSTIHQLMPDVKFAKLLVFVNSAVPCALLGWDAYHHRLGANPQEFVLHTTGTLTLVFLSLS